MDETPLEPAVRSMVLKDRAARDAKRIRGDPFAPFKVGADMSGLACAISSHTELFLVVELRR